MWGSFCEQLKDCGRNGTLFVVALVPVFVAAPFGEIGVAALASVLLGLAVRACVVLVRPEKLPKLGRLPPLSQNDLAAARSKLLRQSNKN